MTDKKILGGTYNARYMTFEEVANSFILNSYFEEVIKCSHTILLGSRGCGKTTLLKMLHPRSLYSWNGKEAEAIRNIIPFFGIYIPCDRQWTSQIDNLQEILSDQPQKIEDIKKGLVNINIQIAICSTFTSLLFESGNQNTQSEALLCQELINGWKISKPISPTFYSITQRLNSLVGELNLQINKYTSKAIDVLTLPDYCYYDFMTYVTLAVEAFEDIFKNDPFFLDASFRWALCFDELEIVPWLYEMIYETRLRSINQKVLFKLTSTPDTQIDYGSHKSRISPSNKEDFAPLKLWVYDNRSQLQWRKFCEKYTSKLLKERFGKRILPMSIFGKQDLDESIIESEGGEFKHFTKKECDLYYENGVAYEVFKRLAKIDKSFHSFLLRRNVDPLDPKPTNKTQESSIHRKIKPIAYYRFYFKKQGSNINGIKRSRKIVSFNYGRDLIYDIADGNPRAFINLINELVRNIEFRNTSVKPLQINTQAGIIEEFCKEYFYPKIVYYPNSSVRWNGKIVSLKEIIDAIGSYFFTRLVEDDFSADPFSFFRIDKESPSELKKIFDAALEAGGILKIEEDIRQIGVKKADRGNIYRLSYSLYPYFNLPQRNYHIIDVSTIITSKILTSPKAVQLEMKYES